SLRRRGRALIGRERRWRGTCDARGEGRRTVGSGECGVGVTANAALDALALPAPTPHRKIYGTSNCSQRLLLDAELARYPPPMPHRGTARLGSAHIAGALRAVVAMAGLCVACTESPVAWNDTRSGKMLVGDALAPDGTLGSDSMAVLATRIAPPDPQVCAGSLVLARARRRLFAVWWRVRP